MGALALLTGCELTDDESVQKVLTTMSRWNDGVQARLFDPQRLAPEFPESRITQPFPFNAYYGEDEVRMIDAQGYKLELAGLIREKKPWTLPELYALPQVSQVTRHICVEGWSAIGKWGGVRFSDFLERIGADTTAKYVGFKCADDYYTSIDMPTALHPQTLLTLTYDGQVLPPKYGFPMKLRMPTKLGYKNPKHIMAITVSNVYPGGYWEDQGYNWFGGFGRRPTEPPGELGKSIHDHRVLRIRHRIRRPRRAPLVRASYERRLVAAGERRVQIEVVAGDHHDFRRIELQPLRRGAVGLRPRLVDADHLAGNDRVPVDAVLLRDIDHQRGGEQGERGHHVAFAQPRQGGGKVRPRIERMPRAPDRVAVLQR